MPRSLSMTLLALLATACVQVGAAPSGSPATPPSSLAAPSPAATTTAPAVSAPPTTAPGTTQPTRTRRPRPQRTDRPTRPPIQPSEQPSVQPPTAPPTEPPLADLVIEDLTAPQSVAAGNPISVGFTIRNIGNAPSGAFSYSYYLGGGGGGGGGSTTVPSLFPGQFFVAYEDLGDADYVNEVVTVSVVVDSRDEVAESDESNNEASAQVQVICADPVLCP